MAHDVFICYSSKDKTTADAVCAVLESEGIRCWIAPRDILAGMSYGEAIVDAIHKAKALVLVFSGHANASPQIEREVERAINKRIPVIPLRIEDVAPDKALEYFLSTPHWLDAFTPPLERHLRNLAGQIHRLIGTTKPADGPPPSAASPFKTVQTQEPEPISVSKPAEPATTAALMGAAAGAAGADAASAPSSSSGSVPRSATATTSAKPAGSPVDWFKKLDTPQKVGIGAGALALVIGVGWLLANSGSQPAPSPYASIPNVNVSPDGGVTVNDGSRTVRVGPDGVRVGESQTPSGQLPSDGNVIPGREMPGGGMAGPADGVYSTVTAADVVAVLAEAGHEASIGTNNSGSPIIEATAQSDNARFKYDIVLYRCNAQTNPRQCMDLQFHTSFSNDRNVTNEQVNAYNRDNRFGQAYFMRDGEIGLDMSATMQGGVSRQHIKEVIDWWKVTLTTFPDKIAR